MKICVVGPSFGYGGANIVAATVGKELAKKNKVYYYSYENKDNYSDLPEEDLFFSYKSENKFTSKLGKGIEMILKREFTPSRYKQNEIEDLCNIIEQKNVDIVILNSFIAVTIFAEKLKEKFPDRILIAWMHEAVEHSFGILAKNYLTSFKRSLKIVDQIICLTKKDLKVFRKYNGNSMVIYNPLQFTSPQKSNLNKRVISFTTRLDIQIKGLDYLMEIAKKLPADWTIRIAANGKPKQIIEFERLVKENNVEKNITYVGPLKGNQLVEHYLESSIFISTSRVESFQLVLIEAMECGLPIISFDHSGAKEVLEYGKYGILVENLDVSSMSKEIEKLINNKDERIKLQKKSIERSKDFKLEKIMNEWFLLLEKWV
ncbi:glycosyltransferase [Enterococcus xiangfangensis]|uniref:glycosyltransferase n=1 Tax=Enterococcus xiangfangensis TaxID=1296537 RepID=UPI003D177B7E|nr:glycosyltransferase [Enterococcus asini]